MVNFQRPLLLLFFRILRPVFVAVLALKPDTFITFLLRPLHVFFIMILIAYIVYWISYKRV
jgi:hypothetical protein